MGIFGGDWLDGTQAQEANKKAARVSTLQKQIADLDRGQHYRGYEADRANLQKEINKANGK